MTETATAPYGQAVDPSEVSYEPQRYDRDSAGNAKVEAAYYYRVSDRARVVWVQPPSEVGIDTHGWFALYAADPADYAAVVPEAA